MEKKQMKDLQVGDKLALHSYKHDRTIEHANEEETVLEITDDMLIVGNYRTRITEKDGRSYRTKEPAVRFFYKNKWYNILGQLKKHGLFYYCNIGTPYVVDDNVIKFIDYDLDLRVFPDGAFRVLDNNEYNYHKKLMNYPEEIDRIVRSELTNLIEMKRKNEGPFEPGIVEKYFELYKEVSKNRENAN